MICPVCLTCIDFAAYADLHKGACTVMAEEVYATDIACPYYIWRGGEVMDEHLVVADFDDLSCQIQADDQDWENVVDDISFQEMVARCGYIDKKYYDIEEVSWILDVPAEVLDDEIAAGRLKLTTVTSDVLRACDIDRWMKEN